VRFWLLAGGGYILALLLGWGLPGVPVWQGGEPGTLYLVVLGVAGVVLLAAAFLLTLILARVVFPQYWWLCQVEGKDVYEFEGVYFVGMRLTRQTPRVQRLVFGVDERMRRWDMLFGLGLLVLFVPHVLGAATAYQVYERVMPQHHALPETLHRPLLSALPLMRELGLHWSADPAQQARLDGQFDRIDGQDVDELGYWFRLGQLHLLTAFPPREEVDAPYRYSPGERIFFNRAQAARGVTYLRRILDKPELERARYTGGALTLLGFFHLSDHNYARANEVLTRAMASVGDGDASGIPSYMVRLLAAQAVMLDGDPEAGASMLETILVDDRLPTHAYALATEHLAESMRLQGRPDRAGELLDKALELYRKLEDRAGIARVHLRRGVLAMERDDIREARRELSVASSLATGLRDGFTTNMVERLSLHFDHHG